MKNNKKHLNLTLSNGFYITHFKFIENNSVVTLFITDYIDNERVLFDLEKKVMLGSYNFELSEKDRNEITIAVNAAIAIKPIVVKKKRNKKEKKVVEEKSVVAAK